MHFTSVLYIRFQYIRLYGVFRCSMNILFYLHLFVIYFIFVFFICFDLLKDQCYISLGRALPNAYNSNFDEDKMHKKIIKNNKK